MTCKTESFNKWNFVYGSFCLYRDTPFWRGEYPTLITDKVMSIMGVKIVLNYNSL
jgi:hypothetical protein